MSILTHSELKLSFVSFFWILDSVRKILKNFENFSQPAESVRKPDQLVHWVKFFETTAWLCIEMDEQVPNY